MKRMHNKTAIYTVLFSFCLNSVPAGVYARTEPADNLRKRDAKDGGTVRELQNDLRRKDTLVYEGLDKSAWLVFLHEVNSDAVNKAWAASVNDPKFVAIVKQLDMKKVQETLTWLMSSYRGRRNLMGRYPREKISWERFIEDQPKGFSEYETGMIPAIDGFARRLEQNLPGNIKLDACKVQIKGFLNSFWLKAVEFQKESEHIPGALRLGEIGTEKFEEAFNKVPVEGVYLQEISAQSFHTRSLSEVVLGYVKKEKYKTFLDVLHVPEIMGFIDKDPTVRDYLKAVYQKATESPILLAGVTEERLAKILEALKLDRNNVVGVTEVNKHPVALTRGGLQKIISDVKIYPQLLRQLEKQELSEQEISAALLGAVQRGEFVAGQRNADIYAVRLGGKPNPWLVFTSGGLLMSLKPTDTQNVAMMKLEARRRLADGGNALPKDGTPIDDNVLVLDTEAVDEKMTGEERTRNWFGIQLQNILNSTSESERAGFWDVSFLLAGVIRDDVSQRPRYSDFNKAIIAVGRNKEKIQAVVEDFIKRLTAYALVHNKLDELHDPSRMEQYLGSSLEESFLLMMDQHPAQKFRRDQEKLPGVAVVYTETMNFRILDANADYLALARVSGGERASVKEAAQALFSADLEIFDTGENSSIFKMLLNRATAVITKVKDEEKVDRKKRAPYFFYASVFHNPGYVMPVALVLKTLYASTEVVIVGSDERELAAIRALFGNRVSTIKEGVFLANLAQNGVSYLNGATFRAQAAPGGFETEDKNAVVVLGQDQMIPPPLSDAAKEGKVKLIPAITRLPGSMVVAAGLRWLFPGILDGAIEVFYERLRKARVISALAYKDNLDTMVTYTEWSKVTKVNVVLLLFPDTDQETPSLEEKTRDYQTNCEVVGMAL